MPRPETPDNDAPNPRTLTGLLTIVEACLESDGDPQSLQRYFQDMQKRLVQLQETVREKLNSDSFSIDAASAEIVSSNLEHLESVEVALEMFVEAAIQNNLETCWDVLEELEGAADELHQSTLALADFMQDSPLICTHCLSVGPEHICPECGAERLKVDPTRAGAEGEGAEVCPSILNLYESYGAMVSGQGSFEELLHFISLAREDALGALESLRAFQAQPISEPGLAKSAEKLAVELEKTIRGLTIMSTTHTTRSAATLNSGWRMVFKASAAAQILEAELE